MIEGMEGMVRGMFANRNLQGSNASRIFPGVANVAILPKEFADEQSASDYLQKLMEKGGMASLRLGRRGALVTGCLQTWQKILDDTLTNFTACIFIKRDPVVLVLIKANLLFMILQRDINIIRFAKIN